MKFQYWVAVSVTFTCGAGWLLFGGGLPPPDDRALELQSFARQGEWVRVFRMASLTQQRRSCMSEREFCQLMAALAARIGPDARRIEIVCCSPGSEQESRVAFRIEMHDSKAVSSPEVKRTYPFLFARREEGKWRFDLGSWPVALAWMTPGEPSEQLRFLSSTMRATGVNRIGDISTRTVLTASRIDDVANGKVAVQEMWADDFGP